MVVRSRGCCTYREEGIKRGEWSYSRVCYHHKAVAPTFPAKKNMLKGAEEGGRRRVLEATAAGGKYSRRHATASFERLPLPACPSNPQYNGPSFQATIRYGGVKINVIYKVGS